MASASRRQSSFTETRGKRQQFDVECISSDDDDETVNVGAGAAFHVWHRPTEPARSQVPCTVPVAEPVFGVQEGGPTVTHYTAAGDESDSEIGFSPCRDPFLYGGETDVSSGHEFESLVSDLGSGYLVQPDTVAPPYASLDTEPISSPEVTFLAEPLQPTGPAEVRDVAVGGDTPEPWYDLPPGVSLHAVLSMVQRNVGVAVRDILQTELGDPALMDTLHHEVMETFISFGAASYQLAIRDLHLQLQHVEGELRVAPTQEASERYRAAAWLALTEHAARVRDWDIPHALLKHVRRD